MNSTAIDAWQSTEDWLKEVLQRIAPSKKWTPYWMMSVVTPPVSIKKNNLVKQRRCMFCNTASKINVEFYVVAELDAEFELEFEC